MNTNASHVGKFKKCFSAVMKQLLLNVLIVVVQILPDCFPRLLSLQEHSLTRVKLAAEKMSDVKRLPVPLMRNVGGIEKSDFYS